MNPPRTVRELFGFKYSPLADSIMNLQPIAIKDIDEVSNLISCSLPSPRVVAIFWQTFRSNKRPKRNICPTERQGTGKRCDTTSTAMSASCNAKGGFLASRRHVWILKTSNFLMGQWSIKFACLFNRKSSIQKLAIDHINVCLPDFIS